MLLSLRYTGTIVSASAALFILACSGAAAQSPEQVAGRYFTAMENADWKTCTELMHPDELARFKAVFLPLMDSPKGAEGAQELMGLNSAAEFKKLSDSQVFEKFLTHMMGKSDMGELMSTMRATVVGSVMEGKDTAHVLYRMKMNAYGTEVEELEVSTLKRYGDTWRLALDKNTEGMAEAIRQMVAE